MKYRPSNRLCRVSFVLLLQGSAALAADDAGGELMPAGRRGSTRSRSSLDARSEHGELIAAAKAAAAEWKQQVAPLAP